VNVGDLVNPFWTSKVAGNTAEIGLCVYLGALHAGGRLDGPTYYTLLSSEGMIEIPTWHWELEVLSECR
jgi:hypothetical protein